MFSSSMRAAFSVLTCWAALGAGAREAGAAEPWLRSQSRGGCSVLSEQLAQRIRDATLGPPNPDLHVEVTLSGGERASARVRLWLGSRLVGMKQLEAGTCHEVVEAITAVVALALSSESEPGAATSPALPSPAPSTPATRLELRREPAGDAEPVPLVEPSGGSAIGAVPEPMPRAPALPADELTEEVGHAPGRWRLLLGMGADRGSLSEATLVLRAGAAARVGPGELRGVATYGVPSVREEVSDVRRSERGDFGAAALDYCLGFDHERWASACAGLELVVRRHSRAEQAPEEVRIEVERFEASPSLLGGLAFVYRDATLQPGLDLTVQRPLLGALAEGPPLAFRAAVGAALQF